ncbi:hypothetical protein Mgra_00004706 [Meloidogyne graminicola]|uniref:Uncharacterized protein n=1 Tax=Meloidogyne graminicola TaxID=189291 RepID=A0A8S9ZRI0_9BILA|nr:hypothetical protein Mgra_00004706 [Meloidogyne graminicola]
MQIKDDDKQRSTNELYQKNIFNPFKPRRAVIVSKSSLLEYEFEKLSKPYESFNDQQLITQLGQKYSSAVDLKQRHDQQQQYIEAISRELDSDDEDQEVKTARDNNLISSRWLALNEVFIGESHAARVSYYDVQIDNGPLTKQKSSGMTICTGTGSSSWHFNINRMTEQTIEEILSVIENMGLKLDQVVDAGMIQNICRKFNEKLRFGPELTKMAFSIRDPVFNATFPKMAIRGFANKILIKSRCKHAHLILDGSTSLPFNRGTEVLLEIHPEDALRTALFSKEHRS